MWSRLFGTNPNHPIGQGLTVFTYFLDHAIFLTPREGPRFLAHVEIIIKIFN